MLGIFLRKSATIWQALTIRNNEGNNNDECDAIFIVFAAEEKKTFF